MIAFAISSCDEPVKKAVSVQESTQTEKMDLIEGEMPIPPSSVLQQKPVSVESWFYSFANSPLAENVATFRLGLFGMNDSLFVIAERHITQNVDEHNPAQYKHYVITSEGFKTPIQNLPDVVREFQKKVQELGRSEKYKTTVFAKGKTITLIFDTEESVLLGK